MIQTLCDWIASFPGFAGKQFRIDRLEAHAQAASVLCRGQKLLEQHRDISGRRTQRRQLNLLVQVRGTDAQTMLDFGTWASTGAPVLGSDQTLQVEQESILKSSPCGLDTYQCALTVAYTQEYGEGMTAFLLDGQSYDVRVTALTRKFAVPDARSSGRTLDGSAYREPVGTLYHYAMTVSPMAGDTGQMDALWEALSQPVKSHVCTFPYGQHTLTQRMYVRSGEQGLTGMTRQGNHWGEITVEFEALAPEVMP